MLLIAVTWRHESGVMVAADAVLIGRDRGCCCMRNLSNNH